MINDSRTERLTDRLMLRICRRTAKQLDNPCNVHPRVTCIGIEKSESRYMARSRTGGTRSKPTVKVVWNLVLPMNWCKPQYFRFRSVELQPIRSSWFICVWRILIFSWWNIILKYHDTNNPNHVLYRLLPLQSTAPQNYNLWRRFRNLQVPARDNCLNDCIISLLECFKGNALF